MDLTVYFEQKRGYVLRVERYFGMESVLSVLNWWNFMYFNGLKSHDSSLPPHSLLDMFAQIKINVLWAHSVQIFMSVARYCVIIPDYLKKYFGDKNRVTIDFIRCSSIYKPENCNPSFRRECKTKNNFSLLSFLFFCFPTIFAKKFNANIVI